MNGEQNVEPFNLNFNVHSKFLHVRTTKFLIFISNGSMLPAKMAKMTRHKML